MGALNFGGNAALGQAMYVDNRVYPGGPTVWYMDRFDLPAN
jgi:hypothetical protein